MSLFNWINLLEVWRFLKSGLKNLYYVLPVQAPADQISNYRDNSYIFPLTYTYIFLFWQLQRMWYSDQTFLLMKNSSPTHLQLGT